jgi:hypothetical protein
MCMSQVFAVKHSVPHHASAQDQQFSDYPYSFQVNAELVPQTFKSHIFQPLTYPSPPQTRSFAIISSSITFPVIFLEV